MSLIVKYVFITPWCPANKLAWYSVMILSAHTSGIAKSAFSLLGTVINLNSKESSKINLFDRISTLHMTFLLLGNLFWAKNWYMSLKYGLVRYPTCSSLMVRGKCVPFSTFLLIIPRILSISVYFERYFCTNLDVFTKSINSCSSSMYDWSGLTYISEIIPSWWGEFSSKSKLGFIYLTLAWNLSHHQLNLEVLEVAL